MLIPAHFFDGISIPKQFSDVYVLLWSTDIALAEVEKEKKLSYVKAWEESEKAKAENRQDFMYFNSLPMEA